MKPLPAALSLLAFAVIFASSEAQAGPRQRIVQRRAKVNAQRKAKADQNNDGIVDRKEIKLAKNHTYLRKRSDVDRAWEKKADKNDDGTVDATELRTHHLKKLDDNEDGKIDKAERAEYWKDRAIVNTDIETKYDEDENGRISWSEAKEMLKDKARVVATDGKAIVNTDIELEFDENEDGIIDRAEAKAIREAISEDTSSSDGSAAGSDEN